MGTETVWDPRLRDLAELAKALAHPARLRILQILAETPGCICGHIVDRLPLSQATVSQHLKELRRVGLIRGEISGPRTCYCLEPKAVAGAQESFAHLFGGIPCCAAEGEGRDTSEPKD